MVADTFRVPHVLMTSGNDAVWVSALCGVCLGFVGTGNGWCLCAVGRLQLHWERATKAVHQIPRSKTPQRTHHLAITSLPSCPPLSQQQTPLGRHCQVSSKDFRKHPGSIFDGKLTQQWFLTVPAELPQSASAIFTRNGGKTKQLTPPNCSASFTTAGRLALMLLLLLLMLGPMLV